MVGLKINRASSLLLQRGHAAPCALAGLAQLHQCPFCRGCNSARASMLVCPSLPAPLLLAWLVLALLLLLSAPSSLLAIPQGWAAASAQQHSSTSLPKAVLLWFSAVAAPHQQMLFTPVATARTSPWLGLWWHGTAASHPLAQRPRARHSVRHSRVGVQRGEELALPAGHKVPLC